MDIYSFLNSKDIADHCRKINHTWNPFEMAVIIGISIRPMADRHVAWRELIDHYPEMATPKGYHHESYPSLHEKLAEAIEYEELYHTNALALFKKPEQGAVYMYRVTGTYGRTDRITSRIDICNTVFSSLEAVFADMKNDYEREEIQRIKIVKSHLDDVDVFCKIEM